MAGQFYPGSSRELAAEVDSLMEPKAQRTEAIGCVLPHAGYMYSGAVAGATVSRLIVRDHVFLLGPNHTGLGTAFSVMTSGEWRTPLGSVRIDSGLAGALTCDSDIFSADEQAHAREHSLEVELPFLQRAGKDFSIVPVTIGTDDEGALKEAGRRIAGLVRERGITGKTLIVASSDMTHYEPQQSAEKKDRAAIDAVLSLDADTLYRVVRQKDISMCGFAPAVTMLTAVKELGAKKAELIKYSTSGDVTGDRSSVVGYAGIIIY